MTSSSTNDLIQLDTGAGKTRVIAAIIDTKENVLCIAHRNILIKQLSRELARHNIIHNIIGTTFTRRLCITEHRKMRKQCLSGTSSVYVCSIDSLLSRHRRALLTIDTKLAWTIIVDEAHHMVDVNKWGKLRKIFPQARIIGATATPCRLDGVSLARGKGGVFDRLVQAESLKANSVKTLISQEYLCDYKAWSVPEVVDASRLIMGAHDFTQKSLNTETQRHVYEMAGDAVKHYLRLAKGKQALAFCVSIAIAEETAKRFRDAGISSAAIHSDLSAGDTARVFSLFESRQINVLFNVDMIGEGVDMPAIEALIMLRKTASLGLYRQWIGRAMRPERSKKYSILIDHVGNIRTHGLPDTHIAWDLFRPPANVKSNLISCPKCHFLIHAWLDNCPECGADISRSVSSRCGADVKYIDSLLVKIMREKIEKKSLARTVVNKSWKGCLGTDLVGRSIDKIRDETACALHNAGIDISAINAFFSLTDDRHFWVKNFVAADISNHTKQLKVYHKWLKLH